MNSYSVLLAITFLYAMPSFAQQDTLIYDSRTGNYTIRYLRENPQTGERDSLVEVIFVPATKLTPAIKASVEFDANSGIFLYSYTISNGADSKQNLLMFLIQFGPGVEVTNKSSSKWRGRRSQGFQEEERNRIWGWHGNQGLRPTWEKGGFSLGSPGIPGIGKAYFRGNAPIEVYEHGLPPYQLLKQIALLKNFPADHVSRFTIVPVAPPDPFVPIVFLDTLVSYKHQAFALGWIKEEGIVASLDAKLEAAMVQIINDRPSAKQILQAFVSELEALNTQSNKITSEAYALLKFNAEYLISKL